MANHSTLNQSQSVSRANLAFCYTCVRLCVCLVRVFVQGPLKDTLIYVVS